MAELTDSDKEFIRTYVAEATDDEEKKHRRRECVDQFGVSLPTISAVTAWTKIREKGKTKLVSSPVVISRPVDPEEIEGCHVNYDNPTKRLWREKWKEFIAKYSIQSERGKMRVLCLPGKRCLEIPIYLELGFKPQNIVGVEGGDDEAKREFIENSRRFGIDAQVGRLENIVKTEIGLFDVVSLDFTGPLSKNCLDIVKLLPIAPAANCETNTKSFFMINLLGKRESQTNQAFIDFYASFTRPELTQLFAKPGRMNLDKFKEIHSYISELADKTIGGEKVYETAELKDKRNIGLVFALTSLIAKDRHFSQSRWANYRIDDVSLKLRTEVDLNHYASHTLSLLLTVLCSHVDKRTIDLLAIGVPQVIEIAGNYRPFLYEIEQYQYSSPVNNASSPFLTEMYQFLTPMGDYGRTRYFLRFFVDAIFWQGLNEDKGIDVDIRDKHGQKRHGDLRASDTISFISEDGIVISSITWKRVVESYESLINHIHKDKAMQILNEGQNLRINLSV